VSAASPCGKRVATITRGPQVGLIVARSDGEIVEVSGKETYEAAVEALRGHLQVRDLTSWELQQRHLAAQQKAARHAKRAA
jgi:hypothetical protein